MIVCFQRPYEPVHRATEQCARGGPVLTWNYRRMLIFSSVSVSWAGKSGAAASRRHQGLAAGISVSRCPGAGRSQPAVAVRTGAAASQCRARLRVGCPGTPPYPEPSAECCTAALGGEPASPASGGRMVTCARAGWLRRSFGASYRDVARSNVVYYATAGGSACRHGRTPARCMGPHGAALGRVARS